MHGRVYAGGELIGVVEEDMSVGPLVLLSQCDLEHVLTEVDRTLVYYQRKEWKYPRRLVVYGNCFSVFDPLLMQWKLWCPTLDEILAQDWQAVKK